MSHFASLVHTRISQAKEQGTLVHNPGRGLTDERGKEAVAAGTQAMQHLASTNEACASDERCHKVWQVLEIAYQGTQADARTALTQLQSLLRTLTKEDSDVAGDAEVQVFRRRLHVLLDH